MVISMISYLATLAFAFMAFTASAQDSGSLVQFCIDPSCNDDEFFSLYQPDLDGSEPCLGQCQNFPLPDDVSITRIINTVRIEGSDVTCIFYRFQGCNKIDQVSSVTGNHGGPTGTGLTDAGGSVSCTKGVCPPT
jgi:hypothetical protein